jgi:hypothetical protein
MAGNVTSLQDREYNVIALTRPLTGAQHQSIPMSMEASANQLESNDMPLQG